MDTIKNPIVSIVIPSYNHGNFLKLALDSIFSQSFTDWEVIIVDNHSTDNTDEVLESYNDPRVRVFKIKNDGIIAVSRNLGIQKSRSELIAFLDSDDYWDHKKLAKVVEIFQKHQPDILYHDMFVFEGNVTNKNKVVKSRAFKNDALRDLLVKGNPIFNSSVVVRKKVLSEVGLIDSSPYLVGAEDYNTWLKIAEKGYQFFYLNECLGYYREHSQSVSNKNMALVMRKAVEPFKNKVSSIEEKRMYSRIMYFEIKFNFLKKKIRPEKEDLLFCLKNADFSIKLRLIFLVINFYFTH